MASLISAVSWIPRGAAAQHPSKYTVDAAELERVSQLAKVRLDNAKDQLEMAQLEAGNGRADEDDNDDIDDDVEGEEEGAEGEDGEDKIVEEDAEGWEE